ncbi:hypothetical protein H8356DRAFT_1051946 [Neocallimastix lanati (nom. inval.)]|jgi:hypothetical protein|uniref:EB domain-containing protein n=1 Tax=Neocallimastix californiae TaxID=1754190 RepID=A0A1Y2D4H6_9FUNG|nr:hypothetical protein H8356DRAFT_1051946 [Neocallimastix sp. JGI-2020a]ORY54172.1 hypothetical protein LY90DRAFT_507732 [Neocallimastix californiae]|eukprot:ORY54172.1 hypothetical protein LY90DRAFT_507732 [Neocallimastix californiae]
MYRILLLNIAILINHGLTFFIENKNIFIEDESIKNFINIENISIPINYNLKEKNKRNEVLNTCKSRIDCDINQICYMNKCYDNISGQNCIEDKKDITHKGNCTSPYYCEEGKCQNRISYNSECSIELEYKCYETQDNHKPKCRNRKCQIKSEEEKNFITSEKGIVFALCFGVFLIIVFFTVFHCVNRKNKKRCNVINKKKLKTSTNENSSSDELNSSLEKKLNTLSIKQTENKSNQDDITYGNTEVLNQFKTNEPYMTINGKKDFDTGSNTNPETPQSISTLINKSYSSTNNLIDRNRISQRSSILNSSYRHNSSAGVSSPNSSNSSPNENSLYNISFQDFNSTNSYTYLSPIESRNLIPQFNTISSVTSPTKIPQFNTVSSVTSPTKIPQFNTISSVMSPTTYHQSFSFSNRKLSPIDSPIFSLNTRNRDEPVASSSIPYILEVEGEGEDDEDNQTTLSFDDGVIKMTNKNSISFSSKSNKDIVDIYYSDEVNTSNNMNFNYETSIEDKGNQFF